MAEEVKPEAIKKTQAALSKYIKKPPLTEKLLKKPPFRFLHDIVTSVIKETGFLEGVFTAAELVADNVKDRDSKVKFLTKLINAVKQATGSPIKAKPNKIVAGLEADKTLELLQELAKGISQKKSNKKSSELDQKEKKKPKESNEANDKKDLKDKKKLKEKSPASSLEKQESQEKQGDGLENGEQQNGSSQAPAQKGGLGETINGEAADIGDRDRPVENGLAEKSGTEQKREGDVRRSGRRRERSAVRVKEGGDLGENGLQENGPVERRGSGVVKEEEARKSGRKRERSSVRTRESDNVEGEPVENGIGELQGNEEEARRSGRRRERSAARLKEGGEEERKASSRRREASASRNKEDSEVEDGDQRGSRRRGSTDAQERILNGSGAEAEGEQPRRRSSLRKNDSQEKTEPEEVTLKRPQTKRASSRSSRGPLKAFGEKEKRGDLKEEEEDEGRKKKADRAPVTLGSGEPGQPLARPPSAVSGDRPRTARRAPPSARPPSARSSRPPSAKPGAPRTRDRGEVQNDISKDESEKEIKEVVVITEADENDDKEDMVVVENPSLQINEVETTRDDSSPVTEGVLVDSILATQAELEKRKSSRAQVDIEWEGRRENGWERERLRLRESVQSLTRAAGPLGKLFAFLQEDVDLASRELAVWRKSAATFTQQLAAEQRQTDEMLKRHRTKLSELDSLIEEQHEAIRSLKSSILTNDKKIQSHISRNPAR